MTKTLHLHIGLQRTGTSSLQSRLKAASAALAAAGIDPLAAAAGPTGAHHGAAHEARRPGRHDPARPGLAALAEAARGSPLDRLLASSEDFSILPDPGVARVARALRGLEVRPILVLRHPLDFAESLYAQASRKRARPPFAEHLARMLAEGRLDFDRIADRWEAAFGAVDALVYEEHPDAAAAVAARMGVALPPAARRQNASLNERFIAASQRVLARVAAGEVAGRDPAATEEAAAALHREALAHPRFAGRPVLLDRARAAAFLEAWRPRAAGLAGRVAVPEAWTALAPDRREPLDPSPAERAEDDAILLAALA